MEPNRWAYLPETASQTAGPYVHLGCLPNAAGLSMFGGVDPGAEMIREGAEGERIALVCQLIDGAGDPIGDAVVEVWQADAAGRYPGQDGHDDAVVGWARRGCDPDGSFRLETVRPGAVAHPTGGVQAPHLALWIVARGINLGLHTRVYFEGDDHAADSLLAKLTPSQRATLVAVRDGDAWRHVVRLQGEGETVFLDV